MRVDEFRGWVGDGFRVDAEDELEAVVEGAAFASGTAGVEWLPLQSVESRVRSFANAGDYLKTRAVEAKGKINIVIASAKGRYAESERLVRSNNASIVEASVEVAVAALLLRTEQLQLDEEAIRTLMGPSSERIGDPDEDAAAADRRFREKYGDMFCSGVYLGGSLDAILNVESSQRLESKRTELCVKFKVVFVKKTKRKKTFSSSELRDLRLSLIFHDTTVSDTSFARQKPGIFAAPDEVSRMMDDMSDRVGKFPADVAERIERLYGPSALEGQDILRMRVPDRRLVYRYEMSDFSVLPEYRKLQRLAYEQGLLRRESQLFFLSEASVIRSILVGIRNDVSDLAAQGDREVVPLELREALDRARPPLLRDLPVDFDGYAEFWDLGPMRTFLQLADLASRRNR